MRITGEHQIRASRALVWRALADSAVLRDSVAGARQAQVRQTLREPFTSLGWTIDPEGDDSASALVRLSEDGTFTLLSYEISLADPQSEGESESAEQAAVSALRGRLEQALGQFADAVAGPTARVTGGLADAMRAAAEPAPRSGAKAAHAAGGSAVSHILNPSVIGGILFLGVLMFVLGLV